MSTLRLKHNPSHMPEDELIRSFVVRQRDLAAILETVRENTGPSNQHLLILGPRGMGKTTLVNRAVAEIRRDPDLHQSWYPILFDEESYTVTSVGELWFQALSHLADQTQSRELVQARRALQSITDHQRLRDAALARLLEFSDAQGKRLLMVFENIDMIFDQQMTDDDAWDVRHTLQGEPRIMVLATSPTRLDSFHDSKKPLYELFREHTLDRLDLEECRLVWRLVTGAELPLKQSRPIQIFTGGNTRLLTILGTFARGRSFRELMDDLVGLIDENTPYFKHNVEALPKDSRKIFVTLADLWSPATSRQVADQIRGDIRAVSAQLGRLERQGIVDVVRRVDKTQMYQVSERMYNLYYLLRRRGTGRVRAVVEFIVCYYDHDGMQRFLDSLTKEACDLDREGRQDHVRAYCELMRRLPDQQQRHDALIRAPEQFQAIPEVAVLLQELTAKVDESPLISEAELRANLLASPNDVTLLVQLGKALIARGELRPALDLFDRALALDNTSLEVLGGLFIALFADPASVTPAILETRLRGVASRTCGPAREIAYPLLACALAVTGAHDEARDIANDALESWPSNSLTATMVAMAFTKLGDPQAAYNALHHALDVDPANHLAAVTLSQMLVQDGRVDEAEAQLRRSLAFWPRLPGLWIGLVDLLLSSKGDQEAAMRELRKAVEQNPASEALANKLGAACLAAEQWSAAEEAFGRVVKELRSDAGLAGLMLALVAQRKFAQAHAVVNELLAERQSANIYLAAATVHFYEGDTGSCLLHLRLALSLAPQRGEIYGLFIMAHMARGDVKGAAETAELLIAQQPTREPALAAISAAILEHLFVPLYPEVARWSRELITRQPNVAEGYLLLARALGLMGAWDEVWSSLATALADVRLAQEHLSEIVALLSLAAARGHASRAVSALADSPSAPFFEPLTVALRRIAGEDTNPPQEIREVADDIVRDIERLRLAHLPVRPDASAPGGPSREHRRHRRARKNARG